MFIINPFNSVGSKDDDSDGGKEGRDFGEPASLIDAFTSAFTDMSTKGVDSDSIKEHVDSFATTAKSVWLVLLATMHPDKDVREVALDRLKNG